MGQDINREICFDASCVFVVRVNELPAADGGFPTLTYSFLASFEINYIKSLMKKLNSVNASLTMPLDF